MKIDLKHNIILAELISTDFERAVTDSLLPKLEMMLGGSLVGVQMYEDYLADNFIADGYCYYPMTVLHDDTFSIIWVKWSISNKGDFVGGAPYAYSGEGLDILIADDVPSEFKLAIAERASYYEGGHVKLNITTTANSVRMLSGRFSQTFVDEMTRQLTSVISRTMGVGGLADSTIELDMAFAPESYMEHTSESVTYRRLLMSARGCAPRDFWIKWRRRDGRGAFSCADAVTGADIEFSLGEDVPHKTREKEYRYLVQGNSNKYQAAMGKKNITEWRELIKRSIKRGELIRTFSDEDVSVHSAELSDNLSEILERFNASSPSVAPSVESEEDEVTRLARSMIMARTGAPEAPAAEVPMPEKAFEPITETVAYTEIQKAPEYAEPSFEEEELVSIPEGFDIPSGFEEFAVSPTVMATVPAEDADAAILRRRLTDEINARGALEERFASLENNYRSLLAELRGAKDAAAQREAELNEQIEAHVLTENALRAQLELEAKERAREKALFAEAARAAKEENERLHEEAKQRELIREAEANAQRAEAEEAERARIAEEAHLAELARIEAGIRSREERRREALARAEERRREMERGAMERMRSMGHGDSMKSTAAAASEVGAEKPAPINPENHAYTRKTAKLLFRHNVDPNIKLRIHEIISVGIAYFNKEHVYIRVRASIPEPASVLLDFAEFPVGEDKLLRDLIQLLGNSDLGIIKVIVE